MNRYMWFFGLMLIVNSFAEFSYALTSIPDKVGMNVKGCVSCQNQGIANVVVSDGVEVTQTDAHGIYYLNSGKKNGYVFISVPSNYEVANKDIFPQFFQDLSLDSSTINQCDFELEAVDNSKHVVLLMADIHLANVNNDLIQFKSGFYPEVKSLALEYQNSGTKVYGLTLGDMSFDLYWYDTGFSLPNYMEAMGGLGFPVFNIMGNHDNNPRKAPDFLAESTFKSLVGPSYYSFNLGKVHYVVLDAIEYINNGATATANGDRSYNETVIAGQIRWLTKDLATITDKTTPVVVALHCPLYSASVNSTGNQVNSKSLSNATEVMSLFASFSNVRFVSGHTHVNRNMEFSEKMCEHNIAAVCATWWWTGKAGYAGNNICKDGSPGGYGLLEVKDKEVQYFYKGIGFDRNQQFRSYDRNKIKITAADFAPSANSTYAPQVATYAGEYAYASAENKVLINVFNYNGKCKLEVLENGKNLLVSRVYKKDPLHIISYEMFRLNNNSAVGSGSATNNTIHMFQVTASGPTSTLTIQLTDAYGNVYTETMNRPKTFSRIAYMGNNIVSSIDETKSDIIRSTTMDEKYTIYTIGGVLIRSGRNIDEKNLNLQRGFYIVKTDSSVKKILVN